MLYVFAALGAVVVVFLLCVVVYLGVQMYWGKK